MKFAEKIEMQKKQNCVEGGFAKRASVAATIKREENVKESRMWKCNNSRSNNHNIIPGHKHRKCDFPKLFPYTSWRPL